MLGPRHIVLKLETNCHSWLVTACGANRKKMKTKAQIRWTRYYADFKFFDRQSPNVDRSYSGGSHIAMGKVMSLRATHGLSVVAKSPLPRMRLILSRHFISPFSSLDCFVFLAYFLCGKVHLTVIRTPA